MVRFMYMEKTRSYMASLAADCIDDLTIKIDSGASKSAIGLGCFLAPEWLLKDKAEKARIEQLFIDYYTARNENIEYISVASGEKVAAVRKYIENAYIGKEFIGRLYFLLLLCVDARTVLLGNDFTHYCKLIKNYKDDYVVESMNLSEYHDLYNIDGNINLAEEIEEILSNNI